jgi:hypothetical protein
MKYLIIAAALVAISAPAVAYDKQSPFNTMPKARTVVSSDRYGAAERPTLVELRRTRAWSSDTSRHRSNAVRAWDGVPHYY